MPYRHSCVRFGVEQGLFTDSNGRIDFVTDSGASPSVVYGPVLAPGNTAENPVMLDSTDQMVYATFNSNGTNAIVVQAPTNLSSAVSVPVGLANTPTQARTDRTLTMRGTPDRELP